ncbi:MAG: SDR family NAD(P)-dependent oxidoreductase [Acidobacteria bacterium]|nr:SDR family NAD(P)-dependent oxidoreductase [Acidobacteriota bacterium]
MALSIHAFAEKVALITDGENPVGRAVALQLALSGAYVIVGFAGSSDENRRALGELQSLGTLANAVEADLSTAGGAQKLVAAVDAAFGRLDLLVNCPQLPAERDFAGVDEEFFEKTLNTQLKSAFFVTQSALYLMRPRPKPKIVNVFSALDTPESFGNCLLAASQAAVRGLTESLAVSLPANFRVNGIAVSAKKGNGANPDADLFREKPGVPADDVARAAMFLLSSEAVGLNGQILKVG